MALDETIREQAIAWAVRTGDPAFEDWEGFTLWLEQDPANARAYDQVAAAVADASDASDVPGGAEASVRAPVAHNDDEPAGVSRPRWLGGAMAAALALIFAFGAWQARPRTYSVETAPGETQLVELVGGGRVELAGGTRIVLDPVEPRLATLEQGQALFTIRHDPAAPFTVIVGQDRLVDIGTIFEVKHTPGQMVLSVSEGAVVFNPERQDVTVKPGQQLTSVPGSGAYQLAAIAAGEVGEWREGRLTFDDARLEDVAADLSRLSGIAFAVSPRSADQRVSGSLMIEPIRRDPRTLGPLLGLNVRYDGTSWEIEAR
jgi:transmembrane sensor